MNTRKRILSLLLVLVLALVTVFVSSCQFEFGEKEPEPVVPVVPEKTEWPEAGVYYFDSVNDESTLTLNVGDTFSLYLSGAHQSGTYTLDGSSLVLKFHGTDKADVTADYQGDTVSLTYDGASFRFLKKVNYTVTFQTGEGSAVAAQSVVNGKHAAKPADPTRPGFVFVGWYADEGFTTPYSFVSEPVLANVTVYARWSEITASGIEYEVELDANYEGAEALDSVTTFGGKLFDLPSLERTGYTFGGWWFGSDNGNKLSHKYVDGTVLTNNDTLYALWIAAPEGTKLAAPVVNVTSANVSWGAVDGARSYLVTVLGPDGDIVFESSTSSTTVNVPFASYVHGQYTVKVVAQANSGESNNSESVRYFANKALNKVTVFNVIEPSVLSFGGVENAEKYLITVVCGNPEHDHTLFDNGSSKTFAFANCAMTKDGISFTVTAVAEGYTSSVSDTFTYVRNLEQVTGLRLDEATQTVTWNDVADAESYMVSVKCGNSAHSHDFVNVGSATSVCLKECAPVDGGIVVKVYPKTSGYNSPEAVEIVYNKALLGTPSGILLSGTTLSWVAVDGAEKYVVKVGANTYETTTNSYDLSTLIDPVDGAKYTLSVRAVGASESLYSDELVATYYELDSLLTYDKGVVTWAPVIGAERYEVQVNDGEIVTVENGAFSSPVVLTKAGVNAVKVRFVDGTHVSDWVQTEVYAHRIVFDSLGGSQISAQYKAVGDPISLASPEKAGYSFVAWYNVPGGAATNGTAYSETHFNKSGEMVLYAYYKANKYEVTYNYGVGGSDSAVTDEVFFEQNYQLIVPTATDVAGAFGGWFSAPYGMGVQYTDESGRSLVPWSHLEGKELYAFWIDQTLSMTLTKVNGKDVYSVAKGSRIDLVTEVTVPATYRGLPVAFLAGNAFAGCSSLKVINLPETIEQISMISPFSGCTSLEAINVYDVDGVNAPRFTSIDGVLFDIGTEGKTLLTHIPLAKTGTYRIPEGVSEIPEAAFVGSAISKVVVPVGVTSIGREAFKDCTKLTSVVFEVAANGETEPSLAIGARAFMGCSALSRITLPARLTNIKLQRYVLSEGQVDTENAEYVFAGCYSLGNISVAAGNQSYKSIDGALYSKDGRTLILAPMSASGTFAVPEGTRSIAAGAFIDCNYITEVTLPGTLVLVGECAFYDLASLESVSLTGSAYSDLTFEQYAFRGCEVLETVTIGENSRLAVLGDGAFMDCDSLAEFTVPATMTAIGSSAFEGCSDLATLNFAANGKDLTFGENAFKNCSSLETVNIPANVSKIPGVFSGCSSLTAVNVDPASTYFTSEDGVVYDINKTEIIFFPSAKSGEFTLPATLTTIPNGVFQGVSGLTKLTIGNAITSIGDYAFAGASIPEIVFQGEATGSLVIGEGAFSGAELGTLTLPAHTVSVGNNAFYEVSATEIVLNEGLETLGDYAFWAADIALTVPASVKTIGAYCFGGIAGGSWDPSCFPAVTLAVENSKLETIGDYAFYENENVKELVIPASVKTIGAYAFYGCRKISSVTFDGTSSLETIGAYAFAASSNYYAGPLSEITIPASVTLVGDGAFEYTRVETVIFEDGAKELVIGKYAFAQTDSLTTVKLPNRLTTLSDGVFRFAGYNYYLENTLTVTIEGEGESKLTTIGNECFANSMIASFHIPKSVRNLAPAVDPVTGETYDRLGIGHGAFKGCHNRLASVTFEMGGTDALTIGESAFDNAALLTTLVLPARLASYDSYTGDVIAPLANGAHVFLSCDSLTGVTFEEGTGNYYKSNSGVILTADGKELVYYPTGRTESFTVPASVTEIYDYAFYEAKISELLFEGGSENMVIGNSAFKRCTELVSLVLPANVTNLGSETFVQATKLETLTLPAGLASFDGSMVTLCESLAAINVGTNGQGTFYYSDNGVLYSADKSVLIMYPVKRAATEYTVVAGTKTIAANAFYDSTVLEKLILPEGLVEINDNAIRSCAALTEVNVPSTVQLIGKYAVAECYNLVTVSFAAEGEDPLIISECAFQYNSSLASLVFPARLYTIGNNAFSAYFDSYYDVYESALTSVTFAENSSLITIGDSAFLGTAIERIAIPAGVESIGDKAFYRCESLIDITFGEGVTTIGASALAGCSELISVAFPASLKTLGREMFYHYDNYYDQFYCPNLESVTFAPGCQLEYIPAGTFARTAIETITIPAAVKYIEGVGYPDDDAPNVFFEVDTLKSVTFEKGSVCESIGDYVFDDCDGLVSIELPTSVSTLGANLFNYCRNLESITIPETAVNLGSGMFWGCQSLTDVEFKSKTTEIPSNFFYDCKKLERITIPQAVSSIAGNAFKGAGLTEYSVDPRNVNFKVEDGILYTADMTSIVAFPPKADIVDLVIPKEVTSISSGIFGSNSTIKTITFEEGDARLDIGDNAFAEMSNLQKVTLPERLGSIGEEAFYYCTSLLSINLPTNITANDIGYQAFYACTRLIEICNKSSIELEAGDNETCGGIAAYAIRIYSEGESTASLDENGYLTIENNDEVYFVAYLGDETELLIPEGVTVINDYAFYDNTSVEKVTLPSTVKRVGVEAFCYCSELTEVVINEGLEVIDYYAFYSSGITNITLPSTLTTIGERAFYSCYYLGGSVAIGNNITTIGYEAFRGTDSITFLVTPATKPDGWDDGWSKKSYSDNHTVLWGYTGENITYSFVAGEGATAVDSITSATPIDMPAAPTRDGFYFEGWYDNAEFEGSAVTNGYYNSVKTTLYAKWLTEEEFNALFAGTSAEYAIDATNGATHTSTDSDGSSKDYVYFKVVATEDVTLTITTISGKDTVLRIYDNVDDANDVSSYCIKSQDGYGDDEVLEYTFAAGTTYYIVAYVYSSYFTGDMTVTIE